MTFPFLIGKVLTTKPEPTKPVKDTELFPFLIGNVITVRDSPSFKQLDEFSFLIGKVLTSIVARYPNDISFHSL